VAELVLGEDPLAVGDDAHRQAPEVLEQTQALGKNLFFPYRRRPEGPCSPAADPARIEIPEAMVPADLDKDRLHIDLGVRFSLSHGLLAAGPPVLVHQIPRSDRDALIGQPRTQHLPGQRVVLVGADLDQGVVAVKEYGLDVVRNTHGPPSWKGRPERK